MGDIAVDIFLETLKQLIMNSKLLLIVGEKHQIQSLEMEIKYLREFLKVTEKKRNEHIEMMNLVKQIRDVVFESESIVELFVGRAYKQDDLSLDLESVKKEIKTLTAKVKQMYDENMYDINGTTVKKLKHSFTGSSGSGGREKTLVGFKDEVRTLMGKLHDSGEGGQLEIISIIGVGGGGKTTLAREVYDHPLTLQKFEIHAWASVSQDYHKTMKRDLLISILESASLGKQEDYGQESSEDKLGEKVYKCLKGRKYLIVMDDIWDIEAWNDIQRSFPKDRMGSKVLLTSRLPIQPYGVPYVPHWLKPLPKSCSWELLQKKVFRKKQCPPELVDIGKQIAKKCKGLPLAVVAIAGILATEDKTLDVWKKFAKNLCSIIAKNQEGCMEILELSYNHLPLHLKACFLYIGGHPKDSEIPVRELIWLWIAKGFIQQSDGGKSLEAIAQDYLISLIDRNLVMVARKSKSHGGIKACRIHDILRELCLKKAEEDNFLVQNYGDDSFSPSPTNKHRRLFIDRHIFREFPPMPHAQNLRSFLDLSLSNPLLSLHEHNLSVFVENFELLRVLYVSPATSRGEIRIGDLIHLRYLASTLSYEELRRGLNSFDCLSNLETFNLKFAYGWERNISLPHDIVKMVKLRHLYTKRGIFEYHHVSNYDEEEGNMLDSLQTLHRMCACEHCLRLLERTPNLRKLGLCGRHILADLEFLKCLEILYVEEARIGLKLPSTLTRLTLKSTRLKWEELSIIIQTLPSLEVLKLIYIACVGPVWNTSELEEGFSQLKYLKLGYLDIEEWNASEDQFPKLEFLVIEYCHSLERIPIDLANLNELHGITIRGSRVSVEESAMEIQEKQRNRRGDDDCLNITFWHDRWPKPTIRLKKLCPTLTELTLKHTYMKWEELSIILRTLLSLEVLKLLSHACDGPVWNTSELEEGFSQLKYLWLEGLDIKEWNSSEDQFPRLEVLGINGCRELERIPIDLANLNELCEIQLEYSHLSVKESAMENQEKQRNRRGDDDCLNITLWRDRWPEPTIWLKKLSPTLTELTLKHTYLKWEKLSIILRALPSLEVLKLLSHACDGPVWNTSELEEGFSQLKYLKLGYLDIEEWNASEDQFLKLEVLEIEYCHSLEQIPIDLANLNELYRFTIRGSRVSVEESAMEIQEKQRNRRGDDDCLNITFWRDRWPEPTIRLKKLPPTLTELTLQHMYWKWEELSIILRTLPNLEVLILLSHACEGPVWNTSELEEGFSQLKYLWLEGLDIKEWNASEDQFPRLEVLVINGCRELERIPIEFANLNELRAIHLEYSHLSVKESAMEIQEKQRNRRGDDDCLNITTNSW